MSYSYTDRARFFLQEFFKKCYQSSSRIEYIIMNYYVFSFYISDNIYITYFVFCSIVSGFDRDNISKLVFFSYLRCFSVSSLICWCNNWCKSLIFHLCHLNNSFYKPSTVEIYKVCVFKRRL